MFFTDSIINQSHLYLTDGFIFEDKGTKGFWKMCEFENQTGQVTFYPNRTSNVNQGPYCDVSHTQQEISRLVKTLKNRDFEPDDLIFV